MYSKLSLRLKVFLALGLAFITSLVVLITGVTGMNKIKESMDMSAGVVVPRLLSALGAQSAFRRLAIGQYRIVSAETLEEKQKIQAEILEYKRLMDEAVAKGIKGSSEKRLPNWTLLEKDYKAWWEKSLQIQKFAIEDNTHEATISSQEQRPLRIEAENAMDELVVANQVLIDENDKEVAQIYESKFAMLLLVSFVGILLSGILAWLILSSLIKSLNNTASVIQESTDQVAAASSQIAASSQQLSQSATEQAASLEETAASLEEITSMISKSSDNSNSAADSSTESHRKAEEGREVVDQMLTSMDEISQSNEAILTQINESNRQMTEIVGVIQDIGEKTKVINEIVFQTKLLSFNASVEAARAGEHGKGFAVVAEEVGNLAQMSGNTAKEITDMLSSSTAKVEGIVRDTQEKVEGLIRSGKSKVEMGVSMAQRCSVVLNEIVQNVSKVAGLAQEISQASKEQAKGVGEINKAMSQLDQVTQQNAATSEEAASSSEELSAQADSLKSSVLSLIDVINGKKKERKRLTTRGSFSSRPESRKKSAPKEAVPFANKFESNSHGDFGGNEKSFSKVSGDSSFAPDRDDDGFRDV